MTKYILHGGAVRHNTLDNKKFFIELARSLSDGATILFVPFAREKKLWIDLLEKTKEKFSSAVPDKQFTLILASEDIEKFAEQIKEADAIYSIGGDTHSLLSYVKKVSNIEQLWHGKTVAGSSAGAQMLCKYFYDNDTDGCYEGLGILDVKIFVHWNEEKSAKLKLLENYEEKLEILKIPEQKFLVKELVEMPGVEPGSKDEVKKPLQL